ncbi:MAG TPA: hypothetical protein VFM93_12735 [Candidatus Limnocylindria bacterium]|nr:hypothetical protein [Candidatus Limnocylindria bacterium]
MLRQLARLTRPYPVAGPDALAFAIYADADDGTVTAAETGYEGVACVDDAARGVVLLSDLWARTGRQGPRAWAHGLLTFVLWMEAEDGAWLNFAADWEGGRNASAQTSRAGGLFWQARALRALARAHVVLADPPAARPLARALAFARAADAPPDVRALHALAALDLRDAHPSVDRDLSAWCDEIASVRDGDALLNAPGERGGPHLWGHLQEGVLAEAGRALGRAELVRVAERSAAAVVIPAIESGFSLPVAQPYAVASAAFAMERLHAATGDERYRRYAADARAWFDGRNGARAPVYDRERGRVADGIDVDRVSANSGAESNIVGAQALIDEVARALASGRYDSELAVYAA